MDTIRFLESVLGDDGFYCIFAAHSDTKKKAQSFYESVDAAYDAANQLDAQGYDTYFALSTFAVKGSRKADNVKQVKSMFLDIDCGPTKDYPDKASGIKALQKFCKELHLPKPSLVDSGRGVHVYWPLTETVSLTEWLPVAEQLKRKCAELGFNVDTSVTADAARVLRVPTTHNYKDTPPNPVFILGDVLGAVDFDTFSARLGKNLTPVPTLVPKSYSNIIGSNALTGVLAGNTTSRFRTILGKTMEGKGCEQLKIIATQQAHIDEPLWRAGLSIANACMDGEKAAHVISCKHPQYNKEETLDKMHRIQGPYLCDRFNEFNPNVCGTCPHWGKIKSPIVLGKEFSEALTGELLPAPPPKIDGTLITETSQLPRGYKRGQAGSIFRFHVEVDEAGNKAEVEELVYKHNLYAVKRVYDSVAEGECVVMRLHLPQDGMREFTIPMTTVTAPDRLREALSKHGVTCGYKAWVNLMTYVTDWVEELQARLPASEAHNQFGWANDHTSFLLGDKEYTATEVLDNPPSVATSQYFPAFTKKGTLKGWKQMINFYNRPGLEIHQFMVGLSFGATLMDFIENVPAGILHIYSKDGGIGKTTALWAATSVWGDYEKLTIKARDTDNFTLNRADVYKNLPLCIDELTNNDPEEMSNMCYQIMDGVQKGRMTSGSNAERPRGNPWSLMAMSTGNTSFMDRVSLYKSAPLAEMQRVLEVRVSKHDFRGAETSTEEFNVQLANNFGHAGPVFVQYLLNHKEECIQILNEARAGVRRVFGFDEQNRFWNAELAVGFAGLKIAEKAGLVSFREEPIMIFLQTAIGRAKSRVIEMKGSVTDTLNNYIADIRGNTLTIDDAAANNNGLDGLTLPARDPYNKLYARAEPLPGGGTTFYLRKVPLRAWCARQQIDYSDFLDGLTSEYGAKETRVRLLRGTHLAGTPAATVLHIELDGK